MAYCGLTASKKFSDEEVLLPWWPIFNTWDWIVLGKFWTISNSPSSSNFTQVSSITHDGYSNLYVGFFTQDGDLIAPLEFINDDDTVGLSLSLLTPSSSVIAKL